MDDLQLQAYTSAAAKLKATTRLSSRLPASVLLQIFVELVRLYNTRVGNDAYKGILSPTSVEHPHLWLAITHVCREWRYVALDCSALWTRIIWCGIPARVEAFLERSGMRPLTLEASKDDTFSHPDLATWRYGSKLAMSDQFLAKYSHRIRSIDTLSLELHHGPPLSLPILHDIHVVHQSPPALDSANMPKLQVVRLTSFPLQFIKSPLRQTVTCLRIDDKLDANNTRYLTLQSWVWVLRELPCLQELILRHANAVVFPLGTLQQELRPTRSHAEMRHLTRVAFIVTGLHQIKSCALLLSHIACPVDAHITLEAVHTNQSAPRDLLFVLSRLGSRPSLLPYMKATPLCPPSINVRGRYLSLQMQRFNPAGISWFNIRLGLHINDGIVDVFDMELPISASVGVQYDVELLRHVLLSTSFSDLDGLFVGRFHLDASKWMQLAHMCPLLRMLILAVKDKPLASLIEALEQSVLAEEPQKLFPRLSSIHLLVTDEPSGNSTHEVVAALVERLNCVMERCQACGLGRVVVYVDHLDKVATIHGRHLDSGSK